jgi:sulfopyruvate decarboxylase alpha subunit
MATHDDTAPDRRRDTARRIADQLADAGVRMVASLPDNWISELIREIDADRRFRHVPVNREESAIGLCSGAYMGGMGSAALMGASGFMTVIYALTKINYSYEIPLLMLITLRGGFGDHHKHHVSNSLYLRPVMEALNIPYQIVNRPEDIGEIGRAFRHSRTFLRPTVVAMTRDLLR